MSWNFQHMTSRARGANFKNRTLGSVVRSFEMYSPVCISLN